MNDAPKRAGLGDAVLKWSGILWFLIALAGQAAFVAFIALYYGTRTAAGNFAAWNEKPLIDGYISGDPAGNALFAAHVFLAAVITLGGLMQLIPTLRNRFRRLHRWNGRAFLVIGYFMAIGGLVLVWGRGTRLSTISAIATSLDAILILIFATIAWRLAMARRIDAHRRWAMRTFMAVNAVWFLRVGIMAWFILAGGVGMTRNLSGPADVAIAFGCYLVPLAVLEVYFAAQKSETAPAKFAAAALVFAASVVTGVGVFGTVAFMWLPYV
ncbi:MAG: DUF2306 domain-containing protein [Parvularculaceae bacterium]